MPASLVKFHALFTATIEVNASYFPHFAAFNHSFIGRETKPGCILVLCQVTTNKKYLSFVN